MLSKKLFFSLVLTFCLMQGCGSESSSSNPFGSAIGLMALSSPTARTTDATASLWGVGKKSFFGMLNFTGVSFVLKYFGLMSETPSLAGTTDLKDLATVKSEISAILEEDSVAACLTGSFSFAPTLPTLTCYGPSINYEDHPHDGTSDGQFPTGDAGIWSATETGGEACAAAKMNEVMKTVGDVVNGGIKTLASLLCVANVSGMTIPAVGGTALDFVATLNANVSGASFSTAALEQLSARSGATATYRMTLVGTVNSKIVEMTLIHSPTNSANTTFMGHLHGKLGYNSSTSAFSLAYNQGSSTLNAVLRLGDMTTATDTAFDGNNDLNYSASTFVSKSVYYNLISVDTTNGLGTAYSAWQANPNDTNTRVFQAQTTAESPADTGVAYFGFGPQITTSSGRGSIDRMICNWSGPGNSHTGISKAQKQTMTRNASGIFVPSASNITYAITNNCDNSDMGYKIATAPSSPAVLGSVTNNLVALPTSGIASLSEPTY